MDVSGLRFKICVYTNLFVWRIRNDNHDNDNDIYKNKIHSYNDNQDVNAYYVSMVHLYSRTKKKNKTQKKYADVSRHTSYPSSWRHGKITFQKYHGGGERAWFYGIFNFPQNHYPQRGKGVSFVTIINSQSTFGFDVSWLPPLDAAYRVS